MFTGFPESMIQFFLGLRFNNQLSYFEEHREEYLQNVQAPFHEFIEELGPRMRDIDKAMEIRPAKCLARIRRDVRFTKDKSPFRDHLWLLFRRAGEPRDGSVMYWFEITPETVDWGLGFWGENRPVMDLLRRRMAADPKGFLDLIHRCGLEAHDLELGGNTFKRFSVPENIPSELRPWYTARDLYICRRNTQLTWIYTPDIVTRAYADYQAMAPFYRTFRGLLDDIMAEQEPENGVSSPLR